VKEKQKNKEKEHGNNNNGEAYKQMRTTSAENKEGGKKMPIETTLGGEGERFWAEFEKYVGYGSGQPALDEKNPAAAYKIMASKINFYCAKAKTSKNLCNLGISFSWQRETM
jgi:hypothetical protein